MRWYLGIDPGRQGALVAVSDDLDALTYRSRLAAGWSGDAERLDAWQRMLTDVDGSAHIAAVWVEQQRGQAKHVREAGVWCGWALAYGLDLHEPRASGREGWRCAAGLEVRAGKAAVLDLVQRRLVNLDITPGRLRTPHMGIVDAAGIALGCRAVHRGAQ